MTGDLQTAVLQAALRLWQASASGETCAPVRDLIGDQNQELAYLVQTLNNEQRKARGARVIGKKIGLTSFSVQKQLGVDQPDFGLLFDHMQIPDGGMVPWNECMQPKAEAEIAFVMKSGIANPEVTAEEILAATDFICVSLELVGSRISNWDIRITDTIADNAAAAHFVLGTNRVSPLGFDYTGCEMQMTKQGEICSSGKGEACLGSPVAAVQWLAKTMIQMGTPLEAGDIVLSGALGPMVNALPGDHFEAEVTGLGKVSVTYGNPA